MARALNRGSGVERARYGLMVTGRKTNAAISESWGNLIYANEAQFLDERGAKWVLNSPPGLATLEWIMSLQNRHGVHPEVEHYLAQNVLDRTLFQQGRLAMLIQGEFLGRYLYGNQKPPGGIPFGYDIAQLPFAPGKRKRASVYNGNGLAMIRGTKQPEGVWQWLHVCSTKEAQAQITTHWGSRGAHQGTYDSWLKDGGAGGPAGLNYSAIVKAAGYAVSYPVSPVPEQRRPGQSLHGDPLRPGLPGQDPPRRGAEADGDGDQRQAARGRRPGVGPVPGLSLRSQGAAGARRGPPPDPPKQPADGVGRHGVQSRPRRQVSVPCQSPGHARGGATSPAPSTPSTGLLPAGGAPAGRGPGAPSRRALLLVAAGAAGTLGVGALGFGAGGRRPGGLGVPARPRGGPGRERAWRGPPHPPAPPHGAPRARPLLQRPAWARRRRRLRPRSTPTWWTSPAPGRRTSPWKPSCWRPSRGPGGGSPSPCATWAPAPRPPWGRTPRCPRPASTSWGSWWRAFRQIDSGRLRLEDDLLLTWEDYIGGAGVLQARIGQRVSVADALRLMVRYSDNVAAQALLRRIGVEALNATYGRLGMTRSRFFADSRPDVTTAADVATLLVGLGTGQLAPPAESQWMLDCLALEQPSSWISAGLPAQTVVAHKTGQLPGVRNDAAIVYPAGGPYVLVVLADRLRDERAGEGHIGEIAARVHAHLCGA